MYMYVYMYAQKRVHACMFLIAIALHSCAQTSDQYVYERMRIQECMDMIIMIFQIHNLVA